MTSPNEPHGDDQPTRAYSEPTGGWEYEPSYTDSRPAGEAQGDAPVTQYQKTLEELNQAQAEVRSLRPFKPAAIAGIGAAVLLLVFVIILLVGGSDEPKTTVVPGADGTSTVVETSTTEVTDTTVATETETATVTETEKVVETETQTSTATVTETTTVTTEAPSDTE